MSFAFFCFNFYKESSVSGFSLELRTSLHTVYTMGLRERMKTAEGGDELHVLSCFCLAESVMAGKRLHQADGAVQKSYSVCLWKQVISGLSGINPLMLSTVTAGIDLQANGHWLVYRSYNTVSDTLSALGPHKQIFKNKRFCYTCQLTRSESTLLRVLCQSLSNTHTHIKIHGDDRVELSCGTDNSLCIASCTDTLALAALTYEPTLCYYHAAECTGWPCINLCAHTSLE